MDRKVRHETPPLAMALLTIVAERGKSVVSKGVDNLTILRWMATPGRVFGAEQIGFTGFKTKTTQGWVGREMRGDLGSVG